jgi:hypothetical protein
VLRISNSDISRNTTRSSKAWISFGKTERSATPTPARRRPGRQRARRLRPDLAAVNSHRSSDQHRSIPADPAFRLIWLASNARNDPGVF